MKDRKASRSSTTSTGSGTAKAALAVGLATGRWTKASSICRGTQIEPATSMYETCNGTVPDCAPEYQYKNGLAPRSPSALPGTSDCQLQQSPWVAADSGPEHVDNRSRQVLIAPALRQLEDHVPCPLSLCDCQCPPLVHALREREREREREKERDRAHAFMRSARTHTLTHTQIHLPTI